MSEYKGYTQKQAIATAKYKKKVGYEKLTIEVKQGKKEEFKAKAKAKGLSLTAYIVKLIEEDK